MKKFLAVFALISAAVINTSAVEPMRHQAKVSTTSWYDYSTMTITCKFSAVIQAPYTFVSVSFRAIDGCFYYPVKSYETYPLYQAARVTCQYIKIYDPSYYRHDILLAHIVVKDKEGKYYEVNDFGVVGEYKPFGW